MKLDLKLVIILLAVVIVATVGSAYLTSWVFSSRTPSAAGPAPSPAPSSEAKEFDPELVWDAGAFTVNLASEGRARFIKTSLSFRLNEKESVEEIEKRRVQVRDLIITILGTTTVEELQSTEGFARLKQRIIDEVNELIVEEGGRVMEVYFTERVIQ